MPIDNAYLSPESLFHDPSNDKIYIGLATYPGVAVFSVDSNKILEMIPMPSPIKGVFVDVIANKLYAAAGEHEACLYVYDLNTKKRLGNIMTGFGPTDIAYSEKNKLLFVTNRFSNDISIIDMNTEKEIKRLRVVREPVALEVSPSHQLVAVANLLPDQASTSDYVAAKLTLISSQELSVLKNIELPNGSFRLKDVKFSRDGKFIYVTHLIGRYNVLTNQIEKGWINTNAISIIDVHNLEYYTTVLLDDIYKGAANPYGLNVSADNKWLNVAITGTDELFVIDRESMHLKIEQSKQQASISQSTNQVSDTEEKIKVFEHPDDFEPMSILFKDIPQELGFLSAIRQRIILKGTGPSQIVRNENFLFVSNYFSDDIEIINLKANQSSIQVKIGSKEFTASKDRYGEMLFNSAKNCFQQWQSCASCHPGNGRVDGLNWDLLNDGIGNPKNTKSLLLAHETPPAMATGIRHDAETGVRAGFRFIQFFDVSEQDAKAVDSYLRSLKPVPSPHLENGKRSKSAKSGKEIFVKKGCNNCHYGNFFTDLEQHDMGNKGEYDKQSNWDTPTLIELWRTAPYMHDGRYSSLEDVFNIEKHGLEEALTSKEITDLTKYLLCL